MKHIRQIVLAQTFEIDGNTLIVPVHDKVFLKDMTDPAKNLGKQSFAIMLAEEYEDGKTYAEEEVPNQKAEEGNVGG
jgi:hypothetical protein